MKTIISNFEVKKDKDSEDTLTYVGSSEKKDRSDEVIKIGGLSIKNYQKNPIILYGHKYSDLPVGKSIRTWKTDLKGDPVLNFKVKYARKEYEFADTVYKLSANGFLPACSVGFIPDYDKITYGDVKKGEAYCTYNESELLELSIVNVPCNPDALITDSFQKALSKDIVTEKELIF